MAQKDAEELQIVMAEDVRQEAIKKWGYEAALLKADAARILALATVIELGLVRGDPVWHVSKIHEAVQAARHLLG